MLLSATRCAVYCGPVSETGSRPRGVDLQRATRLAHGGAAWRGDNIARAQVASCQMGRVAAYRRRLAASFSTWTAGPWRERGAVATRRPRRRAEASTGEARAAVPNWPATDCRARFVRARRAHWCMAVSTPVHGYGPIATDPVILNLSAASSTVVPQVPMAGLRSRTAPEKLSTSDSRVGRPRHRSARQLEASLLRRPCARTRPQRVLRANSAKHLVDAPVRLGPKPCDAQA